MVDEYVRGYLKVEAVSNNFSKFMSICLMRNINIYNITNCDDRYEFNISIKDFRRLKDILRKTHTHVRILSRNGLPFFVNKYRHRIMMPIGFLVALLIVKTLSLYVWSFGFEGNTLYTDSTLYEYLREYGITEGTAVSSIDCEKLEAAIRNEFPCVTWVSAELKGTKLNIYVKENVLMEQAEKSEYEICDLVAQYDATIISIVTRAGKPAVLTGDKVVAGDVLIYGSIPVNAEYDTYLRTDYVKADGTIIGEVSFPYEDSIAYAYTKKEYTGREKEIHYVGLINSKYYLDTNIPYELYDTIVTKEQYILGQDIYTPLNYGKITYREYTKSNMKYTFSQANQILENRIDDFCQKFEEMGVQIIEKNVTIEEGSNGLIATGNILVHMQLGKEQPIEVESNPPVE